MRLRRTKPYVCIDVDFAEHTRFQSTIDLDAAAGTWLRCLAHSRAQEQDGLVTQAWIRRTFPDTQDRIEELVTVGLLRRREDGDYQIHAYAPRNQTSGMLEEERAAARERMNVRRSALARGRRSVTANERRTTLNTSANTAIAGTPVVGSTPLVGTTRPQSKKVSEAPTTTAPRSCIPVLAPEKTNDLQRFDGDPCSPNNERTNSEQRANEHRTNALVPNSTSINAFNSSLLSPSSTSSSSFSLSSFVSSDLGFVDHVRAVPPAQAHPPAREGRPPLPASERSFAGAFWLEAFTEGIREHTDRPCSFGRIYLGTLERIVTHHAPDRDVASASAWLKVEAKAFAALWDGKHPAKGLSPDGLERWLNEGRRGPPVFGRPRLVQPSAEEWHEDDWSDLGAKVEK